MEHEPRIGTLSVWAGEGGEGWEHATQVPVVHSVSFGYPDLDQWLRVAKSEEPGHIYGRNSNPTVQVFEEKVRALEGAEAATSFSTGMAAIACTFFGLLSSGDRVVSIKDTYGGTSKLFLEFFPRVKMEAELCDTTDHEAIESAIARGCRIVYLETPTNPTMKVVDLARLSKAAHDAGALVEVDNTFATPVNQRPLESVRGFLPRLRYAHLAANLGAVETIAGPPATTSHVELTSEERELLGIPEGLVRYSVGIEDTEDLIADLEQALESVS